MLLSTDWLPNGQIGGHDLIDPKSCKDPKHICISWNLRWIFRHVTQGSTNPIAKKSERVFDVNGAYIHFFWETICWGLRWNFSIILYFICNLNNLLIFLFIKKKHFQQSIANSANCLKGFFWKFCFKIKFLHPKLLFFCNQIIRNFI